MNVTSVTWRDKVSTTWWILLPATLLCLFSLPVWRRSGYSPDEEITAVLVGAIATTGSPLLPSGILYTRGLPFLYSSWLIGAIVDHTLVSYRLASLLWGLAGLVPAFYTGLRLGGVASAVLLAVLLATFPPYVAAAVFARQYSALLASSFLFVLLFWKSLNAPQWQLPALFVLALAVSLHPLGVSLTLFPLVGLLIYETPGRTVYRFAALGIGVASVSLLLVHGLYVISLLWTGTAVAASAAVHAIPSPTLPTTYVSGLADVGGWLTCTTVFGIVSYILHKRLGHSRPIVIVCAVCGMAFLIGLMLFAAIVSIMCRPRKLGSWLTCMAATGVASILWWASYTALITDAHLSLGFAWGLAHSAMVFPWSPFRYSAEALPLLIVLASLGVLSAIRSAAKVTSCHIRCLSVVVLVILATFDALAIPLTERYFALPWALLATMAVFGVTSGGAYLATRKWDGSTGRSAARVILVPLLLGWLASDYIRYGALRSGKPKPYLLAIFAPSTGASWTPTVMTRLLRSDDTVVCTEELACLYLLGRVDYLLALSPIDTAHYVVARSGRAVGFYGGAPAITAADSLTRVLQGSPKGPCTLLIRLRTGKVEFETYHAAVSQAVAGMHTTVLISNREAHISRTCANGSDSGSRLP